MQELQVSDIIELFINKIKWLCVGLVCGALLLSAYTLLFVDSRYTASISLYVQNTENNSGVATSTNLSASQMLTNTYVVILQDAETLERAAKNMTVSASAAQLARSLSISTSEDTAIITVTAKTGDPLLSQAMCQAMASVAPEMLREVIGAGLVKTLGDVSPAVEIAPNYVGNGIAGAVGGMLVAAVILLVLFMSDTTVRNKEDLQRVTKLPVLGEIPMLGL